MADFKTRKQAEVTAPVAAKQQKLDTTVNSMDYGKAAANIITSVGNAALKVRDVRDKQDLKNLRTDTKTLRTITEDAPLGAFQDPNNPGPEPIILNSEDKPVIKNLTVRLQQLDKIANQTKNPVIRQEFLNTRSYALLQQFTDDHGGRLLPEAVAVIRSITGSDPTGSMVAYEARIERQANARAQGNADHETAQEAALASKFNYNYYNPDDRAKWLQFKQTSQEIKTEQGRLDLRTTRLSESTMDAQETVTQALLIPTRDEQTGLSSQVERGMSAISKLPISQQPEALKQLRAGSAQKLADLKQGQLDRMNTIMSGDRTAIAKMLKVDPNSPVGRSILDNFDKIDKVAFNKVLTNNPTLIQMNNDVKALEKIMSDEELSKKYLAAINATADATVATAIQSSPSIAQMYVLNKHFSNFLKNGQFSDAIRLGGNANRDLTQVVKGMYSSKGVLAPGALSYRTNAQQVPIDADAAHASALAQHEVQGIATANHISVEDARKVYAGVHGEQAMEAMSRLGDKSFTYESGNDVVSRDKDMNAMGAYFGTLWGAKDSNNDPLIPLAQKDAALNVMSAMLRTPGGGAELARILPAAAKDSVIRDSTRFAEGYLRRAMTNMNLNGITKAKVSYDATSSSAVVADNAVGPKTSTEQVTSALGIGGTSKRKIINTQIGKTVSLMFNQGKLLHPEASDADIYMSISKQLLNYDIDLSITGVR